jgi:pimeloyl-ACP methyl ester carboxylesterase
MTTTRATGSHRVGTAVAADGGVIGYRSVGAGPGLVVLHGTMQSAVSQRELAELLAAEATVHLVDRRGRAASSPYAAGASTAAEVADLAAVLDATGARTVMGVSSGALIALRAALTVPAIDRLVLFEPPLLLLHPAEGYFDRFTREREAGDLPAAMVTAMLMGEMGPGLIRAMPRPLLRTVTARMLAKDERKADPDRPRVRVLAEALTYDFAVIGEQAGTLAEFGAVAVPTLLLNGTKTRPYLKAAAAALAGTVPDCRWEQLAGLNHGATQNKADWGKPHLVAPVILDFLRSD